MWMLLLAGAGLTQGPHQKFEESVGMHGIFGRWRVPENRTFEYTCLVTTCVTMKTCRCNEDVEE